MIKNDKLKIYYNYIEEKTQLKNNNGFKPLFLPDMLFDFQKYTIDFSLTKGRTLIAQDCGLGKTFEELVFAKNIVMKTNKNVLLLTPLAVGHQFLQEAEKFGIDDIARSSDGTPKAKITVTNYEQLHKFNKNDYICVICDESAIIKNPDGTTKFLIVEFMKKIPYRLLATATASPNDYIELGTSSEALGYMGFTDILSKFFKNDSNNVSLRRRYGEASKFSFKGKAEVPFWQYVASWTIAMRKPSDIGFEDNGFILPKLIERNYLIEDIVPPDGMLFNLPARRLDEQRDETKRTIQKRCEKVAELADTGEAVFIGCHLNPEGILLKKLISDSVEVSGSDSDETKEQKFIDFANGNVRVLITKPKIGAWGLNFQHCNHVIYFPSHSYEQEYQFVRRCLRFGQKKDVIFDRVYTEGLIRVMENVQRKSKQADNMFERLVKEMHFAKNINTNNYFIEKERIPEWL